MTKLEVCFVGVGSIAKRHIKNLKKVCEKRGINLTINALRHGNCNTEKKEQYDFRNTYWEDSEIKNVYGVIFQAVR